MNKLAKITQENLPDVLRIQGINAAGYGTIPKSVMIDQRITPTAKLIYAYFCSYAGAGDTAFPSQSKIRHDLKIKDPDTFRKHLNFLKAYGYILVEQEQGEKGRFAHNIYTLVSNPVETIDIKQPQPLPKKPVTENIRDGKYPQRKKPTTINNSSSKINNNFKNNNNSGKSKNVVVSPEAKIITERFQELYGADLNKKRTQELINEKGLEEVTSYLNNYSHYIQGREVKNLGADFYNCVLEEYSLPKGLNNKNTPDYANFDQRKYKEEDFEPFYANLND